MPSDLQRFIDAQQDTYVAALRELRAGRKTGHWMWFIFPQLAGLGRSEMSRYYGITSLAEARAYLADPVLGPRLRECVAAVLEAPGASAEAMLGPVDALKLRSSMTLFWLAAPSEPAFQAVLERFYDGIGDSATESMLAVV